MKQRRSVQTSLLGAAACLALAAHPAIADGEGQGAATAPQGGAGMTVHVDPQTGQIVPAPTPGAVPLPMSPQEQDALSTSSEGLNEVPAPGGGYMIDLQGRFQSPLIATIGPDGKVRIQHLGPQSRSGHGN